MKKISVSLNLVGILVIGLGLNSCGGSNHDAAASLTSAQTGTQDLSDEDALTPEEESSLSVDLKDIARANRPKTVEGLLRLFPMEKIASADLVDTESGTELTFYDADGNKVKIPKVFMTKASEGGEGNDFVVVRLKTRVQRISLFLVIDKANQNQVTGLRQSGFIALRMPTLKKEGDTLEVQAVKKDGSVVTVVLSRGSDGTLVINEKE